MKLLGGHHCWLKSKCEQGQRTVCSKKEVDAAWLMPEGSDEFGLCHQRNPTLVDLQAAKRMVQYAEGVARGSPSGSEWEFGEELDVF